MDLAGVVLTTMLIAQQPSARRAMAPPASEVRSRFQVDGRSSETVADASNAPDETAPTTSRAASVARNILAPDPHSQIVGTPVPLVDLLSAAGDRRGQLAAVKRYWQFCAALGVYHVRLVEQRQLDDLALTLGNSRDRTAEGSLRGEQQAAQARLEAARVAALDAQRQLTALLPASAARAPLPADLPHVNIYYTRFQEIYGQQAAPAAAIFGDRILPVEHRAIDLRAAAVQVADDAWDAARDAFHDGAIDWPTLLDAWTQAGQQQVAFLETVHYYNDHIAEYVLATIPDRTSAEEISGMLIRKTASNDWRQSELPRGDREVEPAQFLVPVERGDGQIRPLPPVEFQDSSAVSDATVDEQYFMPRDEALGDEMHGNAADPHRALRPPYDVQPRYRDNDAGAWDNRGRGAADDRLAYRETTPASRATSALPAEGFERPADLEPLPPHRRAQRLAVVLNSDRALRQQVGAPLELSKCLERASAEQRADSIERYWNARRALSLWQTEVDALTRYETLAAKTMGLRGDSLAALAGLLAEQARAAAKADVADAEAAWIEAQYRLTEGLGGALTQTWFWPTTPPHAGRYMTQLDDRRSDAARRLGDLASTIEGQTQALAEQAAHVIELASARERGGPATARDGRELLARLRDARREEWATRQFLDQLTDYNSAIAKFALQVLPERADVPTLVSSLVVPRGQRGW